MEKVIIIFLTLIFSCSSFAANVYSDNGNFGLKDNSGEIIVKADYKKLIRLGESSWIMQDGTKFGIISDCGRMYVEPKYNQAERILGKYAKLRKGDRYGVFDEKGFEILPVEFSSIDLLYGGMFVTCRNYKYGITDTNGRIILDNIFDDIYMPSPYKLVLVLDTKKIEIERKQGEPIEVPYDFDSMKDRVDIKISEITSNPFAATGYYGLTAADYLLKTVSCISPSYEQTIDELMFSHGADTVNIFVKLSWLPKFPFVFTRQYIKNIISPNNGPLASVKTDLKHKIKD